jgi:hypothetical protein
MHSVAELFQPIVKGRMREAGKFKKTPARGLRTATTEFSNASQKRLKALRLFIAAF